MRPPLRVSSDRGWYPIAGFLLLGGPIWLELFQAGYPLGAVEAWVLPITAGLLGGLAAMLVARLREPAATLAFAALSLVFIDLQFDAEVRFPPLVVAGCVLAAVAIFRRHRGLLAVVTTAGFYLSSLPAAWQRTPEATADAPVSSDLPTLVHVVLDGQWGPAGFRSIGDTATADELERFYVERGFRLFRGAYSHFDMTRYSVSAVAMLGAAPEPEPNGRDSFRLPTNPYFESLLARGYRIRVFESSHLQLCPQERQDREGPSTAALRCRSVPANSLANIGYLPGPWQPRALLAVRYLLGIRSYLAHWILDSEPIAIRRSGAGRAIALGDTVRRAIAARAADAYFVHLLIPHAPYEVDSTCSGYRSFSDRLSANGERGAPFAKQVAAYRAQTRCAHRVLAGLLTALDGVAGYRSIVIVHGDHGPRWHFYEGEEEVEKPGFLTGNYSTLFAVRAPRIPPGTVDSAAAVQDLVADLVEHDFESVSVVLRPFWVIREREATGRKPIWMLSEAQLRQVAPADTVTLPTAATPQGE